MARNKLAGKIKGKSRSSKFYKDNPKSNDKKNEYDTKYNGTKKRKLYRVILNLFNRKNKNSQKGDGKDASHNKNGKLTLENQSVNRARNRGKK